MSAKRLEEIFEECVTAYLENRRSIQESLALYPAYAHELAPLLQTAIQLNETFRQVNPPAHVQERGFQRFMADARARRQVRTLTREPQRRGFFAGLWTTRPFGAAAAIGVAAVVVVAASSAAMLTGTGSGGDHGSVFNPPTTAATQRPTPASVSNIQAKISKIQTQLNNQQPVTEQDITDLATATSELQNADPDELQNAIGDVQQVLDNANAVLNDLIAAQPAVAEKAQEAQDTVRDVAGGLGTPLTTPAAVTATPVNTGPTASPVPTPVQTAGPTAAPTAEPTAEPTPEPEPTITPVPTLGLPGDPP